MTSISSSFYLLPILAVSICDRHNQPGRALDDNYPISQPLLITASMLSKLSLPEEKAENPAFVNAIRPNHRRSGSCIGRLPGHRQLGHMGRNGFLGGEHQVY
jgi:hypothetical protein